MIRSTRPLALAMAAAFALVALPTTAQPAGGDRAHAFVEALGSGDPDVLLAWFRTHMAGESYARKTDGAWRETAEMFIGDLADFEVRGLRAVNDDRIEIVGEKLGDGMTVVLTLDPADDHRVAGIGLELGGHGTSDLPDPQLGSTMDDEAIAAILAGYFELLAADHDFAGAALIARRGEPVFEGAWGEASRRYSIPNRTSTRFDLGSINKSFTRIAIGTLAARGELSLDSTVADLLPDYPNAEAASRITVQHLLDHRSGLPDIFGPAFFESSKLLYDGPRDFFPLFTHRDLDFEPGTSRRYSNSGYMVLGAIVEELTGMAYRDWVERHVFEPAGMDRAGFFAWNEPEPDVAIGHTKMGPEGPNPDGSWKENVGMLPVRGNSAGSAFATTRDLLAFDLAVRAGKLLPPGYTSWFFGGPVDPGNDAAEAARARIGIAGGAPGVSACMVSSSELQVIVLTNQDEPGGEAVASAIFRALSP